MAKDKITQDIVPAPGWVTFTTEPIKTESGIILPDSSGGSPESSSANIVLMVGKGVKRVKPGDEIMCAPGLSLKIAIPGKFLDRGLHMVKEDYIIGVFVDRK